MKTTAFFFFLVFSLLNLGCLNAAYGQTNLAQLKLQKIKNKKNIHAVHEANIGKIVFASQYIDFNNPDAAAFIEQYELGAPLFFRAYWSETLEDAYKSQFNEKPFLNAIEYYKVYINGVLVGGFDEYSLNRTDGISTWFTTWGVLFQPDQTPKQDKYSYYNAFKKALATQLSNIKANESFLIRMEGYVKDIPGNAVGKLMAQGEFKMTVGTGGLIAAKAVLGKERTSPDCMPEAGINDVNLEKEILTTTKAMGWQEEHHQVVIISRDWSIYHHTVTGAVLNRYIRAAVGARKGDKCWYQTFNYYQDYNGSDFNKQLRLGENTTGEQTPVPCSCLFGDQ